jgi:hypothetical protein
MKLAEALATSQGRIESDAAHEVSRRRLNIHRRDCVCDGPTKDGGAARGVRWREAVHQVAAKVAVAAGESLNVIASATLTSKTDPVLCVSEN